MSNKGLVVKQNIQNIANAIKSKRGTLLPEEYTQVEYIESHGTEYIDTGIIPEHNAIVSMTVEFTQVTNDYQFMGQQEIRGRHFGIDSSGNFTLEGGIISSLSPLTKRELIHTIYNGGNSLSIDGTIIDRNSQVVDILNYTIMGGHKNCYCKMYKCTIVNENVLVRDYIPCIRKSDNKPGLYDLVNGVFYTNQGTGEFTYGSPTGTLKVRDMAQAINELPSVPAVSNLNVIGTTQESTSLTITDAKEAQINKIDVLGRTEQTGTPSPDSPSPIENVRGRNLLNLDRTLGEPSNTAFSNETKRLFNFSQFVKGYSGTNYYVGSNTSSYSINNGTIKVSGKAFYGLGFVLKVKENTNYYLQYIGSSNSRMTCTFYKSDGTYISYNALVSNGLITTPAETDFIVLGFQATIDNIEATFSNIQLEEGTEATPYTTYNTINFSVEGKNKFDLSEHLVDGQTYNGITASKNNDGTWNLEGTLVNNNYYYTDDIPIYCNILAGKNYTMSISYETENDTEFAAGAFFRGIVQFNNTKPNNPQTQYINTQLSTIALVMVHNGKNAGDYIKITNLKLQLEESTTATPYEPYHTPQTVSFPLGDKALMQGSKLTDYGFYDERAQVVLNGTENQIFLTDYNKNKRFAVIPTIYNPKYRGNVLNCLSNYFRADFLDVIGSPSLATSPVFFAHSTGILFIETPDTGITTVQDFKTWLSTHPTTVEYELATPTITPYTPEQQTAYNQLKALLLHTGTNIITTDGNLPPNMKIEYKQDALEVVKNS